MSTPEGGLIFDKTPERPNIYESAGQILNMYKEKLDAWVRQGLTKVEATREVFRNDLNSERISNEEKEMIKKAIRLYLNS